MHLNSVLGKNGNQKQQSFIDWNKAGIHYIFLVYMIRPDKTFIDIFTPIGNVSGGLKTVVFGYEVNKDFISFWFLPYFLTS